MGEKFFDMPIAFIAACESTICIASLMAYLYAPPSTLISDVSEQMRHETDFIREANNAMRAAADIASEPKLRGRVIVPKVYWERTARRVMTAEW